MAETAQPDPGPLWRLIFLSTLLLAASFGFGWGLVK